jgi:hypothetical protein
MNPSTTAVWLGEDVADRQHLGTGPQSLNLAAVPFDVMGCDAHTVDAIGFIILEGESGPQKVPVTRFQIVATLCHNKRVVTGYSVCIRPQIEAAHVEEAYLMGQTQWTPKALSIEGLCYAEGAGFPNGVVDGITEVNPALLRLDNAAQHFAKGIRSRLRESLGCAIVWGSRPLVAQCHHGATLRDTRTIRISATSFLNGNRHPRSPSRQQSHHRGYRKRHRMA